MRDASTAFYCFGFAVLWQQMISAMNDMELFNNKRRAFALSLIPYCTFGRRRTSCACSACIVSDLGIASAFCRHARSLANLCDRGARARQLTCLHVTSKLLTAGKRTSEYHSPFPFHCLLFPTLCAQVFCRRTRSTLHAHQEGSRGTHGA